MINSKFNVAFNYLYRDGANYKQWDFEVFTNNTVIPIDRIESSIRAYLIDGEWFYADKWGLKDLHHFKWDNEVDNLWHEFDSVEETAESATKGDIAEFLAEIVKVKF